MQGLWIVNIVASTQLAFHTPTGGEDLELSLALRSLWKLTQRYNNSLWTSIRKLREKPWHINISFTLYPSTSPCCLLEQSPFEDHFCIIMPGSHATNPGIPTLLNLWNWLLATKHWVKDLIQVCACLNICLTSPKPNLLTTSTKDGQKWGTFIPTPKWSKAYPSTKIGKDTYEFWW